MTTSQNGWPASSNKSAINIVDATCPGTDVVFPQGVKDGDVKTVLMYVADQFNKTVEPLKVGQCWGYDYRPIEGSNTVSNHSSGTAIDLNAPAHPMGSVGTFSAAKVAAINVIIRYCEGVVRWGGSYSGRKDEMHFEIVSDAAAVTRVAHKISGHGDHELLAIDGVLGEKTITRWQQVMKTGVDGVISHPSDLVKAVQTHLKVMVNKSLVVDGEGINQDGKRTLTAEALQRYLKTPVDGVISTPTSEVIKAVQRRINTGTF